MEITQEEFEGYLKCPTKCWLRFIGEPFPGSGYAQWVQTQSDRYCTEKLAQLAGTTPKGELAVSPVTEDILGESWRHATKITISVAMNTYTLKSRLHALERLPETTNNSTTELVPIRFVFTNKLSKDEKMLLAFDALVLSRVLRLQIDLGKIVHGDRGDTARIDVAAYFDDTQRHIDNIDRLLSSSSPPDLVLNRHCVECEFQNRCRQKATEADDLSLLSGLSERERANQHKKGIFSVIQFSYTFRPRRRAKRLANRPYKYDYALKALAIRQNKIHLAGTPKVDIAENHAYLDVEGTPDKNCYYLIGLLLKQPNSDGYVQHSFWAADSSDEKNIWMSCLRVLRNAGNPRLIHYGSYETTFLNRMKERYAESDEDADFIDRAISNASNLLSIIYGQIYFPTYSNGLKEIAHYLGFKWSEPSLSGLSTLILRSDWEITQDQAVKQTLRTYNLDDCAALQSVFDAVVRLCGRETNEGKSDQADFVHADSLRRPHPYRWERDEYVMPDFKVINQAAYWDYQREKIYVRTSQELKLYSRNKKRINSRKLPITKIVEIGSIDICPFCNSTMLRKVGEKRKIVHDVNMGRTGVKRSITKFVTRQYHCPTCNVGIGGPSAEFPKDKYGPGLTAYFLFHVVELAVPQDGVMHIFNKLFNFQFKSGQLARVKEKAALLYKSSYDRLLKNICNGNLVHVDETRANTQGVSCYVWVFTNLEEVVYIYTESREGEFMHEQLRDFKGVVVSDFYPAYDSLKCPQQKCLIHLMRDLNNDLMREPYNDELKILAHDFAYLLRSMIETIDRFGLKTYFLKRHKKQVDGFFVKMSESKYKTERVIKYRIRFEKNRNKLFTFLDYDGIPWNNNNAEHAIKAFARIRRVIGGASTEDGLRNYLILLSICETCKGRGIDFLEFLQSPEKDLDLYTERIAKRKPSVHSNVAAVATLHELLFAPESK